MPVRFLVFMLVSHGFEKLLNHFQERFQFNGSKNAMWCNQKVKRNNIFSLNLEQMRAYLS